MIGIVEHTNHGMNSWTTLLNTQNHAYAITLYDALIKNYTHCLVTFHLDECVNGWYQIRLDNHNVKEQLRNLIYGFAKGYLYCLEEVDWDKD